MRLQLVACSVLAVAACGGAKTKPADPIVPQPAAEPVLALGDLKFYAGDKVVMHLHADGQLEALASDNGPLQQIAIVKDDGSIIANGKAAHVTTDGTLTGSDGAVAPFKLEGAALVAGPQRATIDDKGNLLINGELDKDATALRIEGATNAKLQRTALLLLGMMLIADRDGSATPPPPTPAPAP
jgi:hypothetical protein